MSLDTPATQNDFDVLTDWLELRAFLSGQCISRIDDLIDAIEMAQESEDTSILRSDEKREELALGISEEVKSRLNSLEVGAYPFKMSNNGESLIFLGLDTYGQRAYLICLLICQSWSKGLLLDPWRLLPDELRNVRNEFEILSTIAAIGFVDGGPGFLLGSNRAGPERLLERVARICEVTGEGAPQTTLHALAPKNTNDDKIDLIAVRLERDGPPAQAFVFGQSASGADFQRKPIVNEIARFLRIWFADAPMHTQGVVFIPARLSPEDLAYESDRLGHLLYRLRLPRYAQLGYLAYQNEPASVHFVEDVSSPEIWLSAYIERVKVAP